MSTNINSGREAPVLSLDGLFAARLSQLAAFAAVLTGEPGVGADLVEAAIVFAQDDLLRASDPAEQYAIAREWTVRGYLSQDMRLGGPPAADLDTAVPVPPDQTQDRDELELGFAASSKLQRAVLLLRYSEGLDDTMIARCVGLTPGACRAYIVHILTRLDVDDEAELRQLIEPLADDAEDAVPGLRSRLVHRLAPKSARPAEDDSRLDDQTPSDDDTGRSARPQVSLAELAPRRRIPRPVDQSPARGPRPVGAAHRTLPAVPPPPGRTDWRRYEHHLAAVVLVALGFQYPFRFGVTYGDVVALLAAPLWFGAYRRYRGGVVFAVIGLLALVSGLVLQNASSADHVIDAVGGRDASMLFATMIMGVGAVLWARTLMPVARIGVLFGTGMLAFAVATPGTWGSNPWKYAFAIPTTVAVLGLVAGARRTVVPVVTLVTLTVVSVQLDSRAYSAALSLCALVVVLGAVRRRNAGAQSRLLIAVLIGGVALAVYQLATSLLVNGYLGRGAQQRSIAQIHESGSLILGGRPELTATIALMKHRIVGFGPGVIPTPNDILTAKAGLAGINYAPNNGYVEKFMFGGHIELHSVFGDVWAGWGLVGLALIAVVAIIVIQSVVDSASRGTGNALTVYLCVWTLWNIGFSPFLVSVPVIVLAVALNLRETASPPTATSAFADAAPARSTS